jgi:hypothetical protein
MANLMDYLDWRGDLPLAADPFNEVDNLILAELSFVDFKGIVPPPGEGGGVPLHEAAAAFFARNAAQTIHMGVLVPAAIPEMLQKMADSRRFREMKLSGFVDMLDVAKAEQFAALTIETDTRHCYLSFRGTDDTIAGWKEDFMLGCVSKVPAQEKAVHYVKTMARQYPRRHLMLGGHSKGGNLAVYSGVFCPATIQNRISAIYSNDGPGFHDDILSLPEHERVEDRIHAIVPKSSFIGMLLEHEDNYKVVDSTQIGFMQHDGFSWTVQGNHFVHLREVTPSSRIGDLALQQWLRDLPEEKREAFVEAVFRVLSASGAVTLSDLKADSLKAAVAMVKAAKELDKESRDRLLSFVNLMFRNNMRLVMEELMETGEKAADSAKNWAKRKIEDLPELKN